MIVNAVFIGGLSGRSDCHFAILLIPEVQPLAKGHIRFYIVPLNSSYFFLKLFQFFKAFDESINGLSAWIAKMDDLELDDSDETEDEVPEMHMM